MQAPRITRNALPFLIGMPLAWAVLWFHPNVAPDDVYRDLRDEVTAYQIVHVGTLIFIGLMGVALYMLVRDLPGKAATISRLAIGPFVLLYESLRDRHRAGDRRARPARERRARGAAPRRVRRHPGSGRQRHRGRSRRRRKHRGAGMDNSGHRGCGCSPPRWRADPGNGTPRAVAGRGLAPAAHGPIGLACFASAVLMLYRSQRVNASRTAQAETPTPTPAATV